VLGGKKSFSVKSFRPEIIKDKKVKLICHKARRFPVTVRKIKRVLAAWKLADFFS